MPERIYVGAHDAVDVVLPGDKVVTAVRNGDPVEFDEATAREADVSGNWKAVSAPVKKSEKETS